MPVESFLHFLFQLSMVNAWQYQSLQHTHKHTSQAITQNTQRLHPLKSDILCRFKACMSALQFFFSLSLHGSEAVARLPNPEFISSEKRFIQGIAIQGKMIIEN